jgi:hypothetical protein
VSVRGLFISVIAAVAVRPRLWPVSLATMWRMTPNRWWLQAPHVPVPDSHFLRFRLITMYGGDGSGDPRRIGTDVVAWLDWCRSWKSTTS